MIGRGLVIAGAAYALAADGITGLAEFGAGFAVVFGLCCAAHRARYRGVR